MKTSKRSLIMAIAVLCVCALSLSTATFAWFTSVTKADVNTLNLGVASASDLKIAINSTADTGDNIEGSLWGQSFTGEQIDTEYATYSATEKLVDATYINDAMMKPVSLEGISADDGKYNHSTEFVASEWTSAVSQEGTYDYMTFTVYFRTMKPNQTIRFTAADFNIAEGNQNLLPALSLKVNDTVYTNSTEGGMTGDACTTRTERISTTGAVYYTGSATFTIYVDGENAATVNKNSGVNFAMQNIEFTVVEG